MTSAFSFENRIGDANGLIGRRLVVKVTPTLLSLSAVFASMILHVAPESTDMGTETPDIETVTVVVALIAKIKSSYD